MPRATQLFEMEVNGEIVKGKHCKTCKKLTPLSEFHPYTSRGYEYYTSHCIECNKKKSKKYYKENKEGMIEQAKEYYQEHREVRVEQKKKWYKANKEVQIKRATRSRQIRKAFRGLKE